MLWSCSVLHRLTTCGRVSQLIESCHECHGAVLFAQTYKPSRCPDIVALWKKELEGSGKTKVSRVIGVPVEDEEMFPEWDSVLKLEAEGGSHADLIDVSEPATNGAEAPAEVAAEVADTAEEIDDE